MLSYLAPAATALGVGRKVDFVLVSVHVILVQFVLPVVSDPGEAKKLSLGVL
jgi:hypothetical protein